MTEETKEQPKGLFDKFMDLYAPLAKQDASLSPEDYAQDYREKQNYVLKQLGLISPTSGVTTPENTRPVEDILLRNGSQDQPTMDTVEQYVNNRVNYNPELGPVPVKDPNDPDEYRRNQLLEMMEINQMFDGLLQASDLPPISVDQRSAYTSHLLSKPYDAREKLSKKLVSGDLKALEGLDDINAFYASFDPEAAQAESNGSSALDSELGQGQTEDGRSLLQRGLEMIFSPAAAAELTPEIRAQLEAISTKLPPHIPESLSVDSVVSSDLGPVIQKGFDSLAKSEGPDTHLDGRNFLTLPYGIVPDKNSVKKADGTPFDPTADHKLGKGDLSGIDYSKATKFGISREDFTTDKGFAKAVFDEFAARTKKKYGSGFTDLNDGAKQAAYDMSWNAGIGSVSWSSVKDMLKESSKKDNADKSTDILIGFTTNFKSGTDYPRGLLKRRLQTYNLVAKPGEEATTITTTAIMKKNRRTGTKYDIKKSDGSVIKSWTKPDTNERLGDLVVN